MIKVGRNLSSGQTVHLGAIVDTDKCFIDSKRSKNDFDILEL